jgi:membrane protease YdiL (CAAX protease family)
MAKQQTVPPFAQALILVGLLGAGMVFGFVFIAAIAKLVLHIPLMQLPNALTSPAHVQFARVAQALVSFFVLAVPALILGLIVNGKPLKYIGFNTMITGKQFFIIVLIAFAGLLASDALGDFNAWIPIPKAAAHYFKQLEDSYDDELMSLATMKTVADLIISLIVLAFLPAMFEEMFFRGALQQTMIGVTRNAFWGILITAILFSGFHLSYYGFLPRAFLGVVLGYIFYYGKNIWLNISVHFLNNALAVTQMYVLTKQGKLTPDALNQTSPSYLGILGIIAVIFLLLIFKRESQMVISMNSLKRNDDERMV